MTLSELEKDLLDKSNPNYGFTYSYLGENKSRRSFNDLFLHYRTKGVTELMLMQALKNLNFIARYCGSPHRIVFFRTPNPNNVKFWWSETHRNHYYIMQNYYTKEGKYTGKYLEKLYEKCD